MSRRDATQRSLALSYVGLRRWIGFIAIFLPVALVVGKVLIDGPGLQGSISAYYYTDMRNVLVGSLCAIGVFLLSYRYDKSDAVAAILAGIFAIGVALFPTAPSSGATATDETIGIVHRTCAALLFLTLAYFSLFLFTRTSPEKTRKPHNPLDYLSLLVVTRTIPGRPLGPRKKRRNVIYRFCGYAIVVCILLMGIVALPAVNGAVKQLQPVFWLESIAIVAFGFSWLIKGETLLRDRGPAIAPAAARK